MLNAGDEGCLPVVAACLNPDLKLAYDDIDLQHEMQRYHWYISGYKMCFLDPNDETRQPLFKECSADQTMFRVVMKSNVTRPMIDNIVTCVENSLKTMDELTVHYRELSKVHTSQKHKQHYKGHAC